MIWPTQSKVETQDLDSGFPTVLAVGLDLRTSYVGPVERACHRWFVFDVTNNNYNQLTKQGENY